MGRDRISKSYLFKIIAFVAAAASSSFAKPVVPHDSREFCHQTKRLDEIGARVHCQSQPAIRSCGSLAGVINGRDVTPEAAKSAQDKIEHAVADVGNPFAQTMLDFLKNAPRVHKAEILKRLDGVGKDGRRPPKELIEKFKAAFEKLEAAPDGAVRMPLIFQDPKTKEVHVFPEKTSVADLSESERITATSAGMFMAMAMQAGNDEFEKVARGLFSYVEDQTFDKIKDSLFSGLRKRFGALLEKSPALRSLTAKLTVQALATGAGAIASEALARLFGAAGALFSMTTPFGCDYADATGAQPENNCQPNPSSFSVTQMQFILAPEEMRRKLLSAGAVCAHYQDIHDHMFNAQTFTGFQCVWGPNNRLDRIDVSYRQGTAPDRPLQSVSIAVIGQKISSVTLNDGAGTEGGKFTRYLLDEGENLKRTEMTSYRNDRGRLVTTVESVSVGKEYQSPNRGEYALRLKALGQVKDFVSEAFDCCQSKDAGFHERCARGFRSGQSATDVQGDASNGKRTGDSPGGTRK